MMMLHIPDNLSSLIKSLVSKCFFWGHKCLKNHKWVNYLDIFHFLEQNLKVPQASVVQRPYFKNPIDVSVWVLGLSPASLCTRTLKVEELNGIYLAIINLIYKMSDVLFEKSLITQLNNCLGSSFISKSAVSNRFKFKSKWVSHSHNKVILLEVAVIHSNPDFHVNVTHTRLNIHGASHRY